MVKKFSFFIFFIVLVQDVAVAGNVLFERQPSLLEQAKEALRRALVAQKNARTRSQEEAAARCMRSARKFYGLALKKEGVPSQKPDHKPVDRRPLKKRLPPDEPQKKPQKRKKEADRLREDLMHMFR